jgi:hypothetical protein
MNEEQYQYVYNAYRANPYAFTNEQVDQIANAAKRLNVDFGRDPMHEEATIGSVLGNVLSGVVQGFSTIEVGDRPVTTADQIANNLGYLLGFIGFVPGIGTASRFLTSTAIRGVLSAKQAGVITSEIGRKAAAKTISTLRKTPANRVTSVPFWVANKITDGVASSAAAKSATDFFIKKGLQKQTVSKIGDIAKEGFRLGTASAVSSWQYGVDQMAASFVQGGVTGAGFRGIANFVNLGSEAANKFARIAADTIYSGGRSTLAGDPLPVQVYEYALGALFGSMERPLKDYQAAEFLSKNVNKYTNRNDRRRAIDDLQDLDEYKNLPKEVREVVDRDIDITYGSEAKILENILGENFEGTIRIPEALINKAVQETAAEMGVRPEDLLRYTVPSQAYVRTFQQRVEEGKTEEQAKTEARAAYKEASKEAESIITPLLYQGDPVIANSFIPRLKAEEEAYKPSIGAFEQALGMLSRRSDTPSEFFQRASIEASKFINSPTDDIDPVTSEVIGTRQVIGDRPEDVELFRSRLNDLDPTANFTEADDLLIRKTLNTYRQAKERLSGYIASDGSIQIGKLTDFGQDIREVGDQTFLDTVGIPVILAKKTRGNRDVVSEARRKGEGSLDGLVDLVKGLGRSPNPLRRFVFSPVKSKGQTTIVPSLLENLNTQEGIRASLKELNDTISRLDELSSGVKQEYYVARARFSYEYDQGSLGSSKIGGLTPKEYYDLNALNNIRVIEEMNSSIDPDTGSKIYVPFEEMVRNPDKFISSSDELVKRMQGFADSNFSLNIPYFENVRANKYFPTVVENGGFNYAIINDIRSDGKSSFGLRSSLGEKAGKISRLDNTDGALLMRADVFDAITRSSGLEDGIGSIKLTITYGNEMRDGRALGATFHKVSAIRLSEKESVGLVENDISFLTFSSGVKQTGFRETVDYKVKVVEDNPVIELSNINAIYKAPIESIRVNVGASEHRSQVNSKDARLVSQFSDDIADPVARAAVRNLYERGFNGDEAQTQRFEDDLFDDVDIDNVNAISLAEAYYNNSSTVSPEKRAFFLKEVLRKNLPDPDNDYSIKADRPNARAQKVLNDLIDTDYLGRGFEDLDASVKDFIDDRVSNYFETRVSKPKVEVGGQSIFTSIDGLTQRHLAGMGKSTAYENMPKELTDALKKGYLPEGWVVFNEGMQRQEIKWLDGKKKKLFAAFDEYLAETDKAKRKQMEDLLTFLFIRVPNDSAAGILPLRIAGFGQRKGSGMIVHGEELKRMGGADIDIDKAFWYQDVDGNGTGTGPIMDYFKSTKEAVAAEPYEKPAGKSPEEKIVSLFSPSWLQSDGASSSGSNNRIGIYANISKRVRNYLYDLVDNDRSRASNFNRWITTGINSSADGINTESPATISSQLNQKINSIVPKERREEARRYKENSKLIESVFSKSRRGAQSSIKNRADRISFADTDTYNHPRHVGIIRLAEVIRKGPSSDTITDPASVIPTVSSSSVNRIIERYENIFRSDDDQSRLTRFLVEGFGVPSSGSGDTYRNTITGLGSMVALDRRGRAAIRQMEEKGYTRDGALVAIEEIQSFFKGDSGYIERLSKARQGSGERIEDVFRDMTERAFYIEDAYGSSARLYFEMIARGGRRMSETTTEGAINLLRSIPISTINKRIEELAAAKVKEGKSPEAAREEAASDLVEEARKRTKSFAKQTTTIIDWEGISKQTNIDFAEAVTYVARGEDAFQERVAEPRFSETGRVEITKDPETDLPEDPVSPREVEEVELFTSRITGKDQGVEFTPEERAKINRIKEIFHEHPDLISEMIGGGGNIIRDAQGVPIAPELWTPREIDQFIDYFDKSRGGFLWNIFSKGKGDLPALAYMQFPDRVTEHIKPFDGTLEKSVYKRVITPEGIKVLPVREFFTSFDRLRVTFGYAHDSSGKVTSEQEEEFGKYLSFLKEKTFEKDREKIFIISSALRELGLIRKINDDGSLGAFVKGYKKTIPWERYKNIEKLYQELSDKTYLGAVPKVDDKGRFIRDESGNLETSIRKIKGKELFGTFDNPHFGIVNKSITNVLRSVYDKIVVNKEGAEKHLRYKNKEKGIIDLDATMAHIFEMTRRNNRFIVGIDGLNRVQHALQIEKLAIEVAGRNGRSFKIGDARFEKIVENLYERNPFEYENPDVLDAGMTAFQKNAKNLDKSISVGPVGEINMFAYFPHNGVPSAIAKEYVQKLEDQLKNATSDSERNRLKTRISQMYGTMAAPENAFSQSLKDTAFITPRASDGSIVIVKPKPTQSRGREPMPGYDPSDAAIKNYISTITKGYYDTLSAVVANHEMNRFEARKSAGEYTSKWAEWGRTYLRTVLGQDTMYSDEYLKKNPTLARSAAYYTSDRYAFDKYYETIVKRFNKKQYKRVQKIKADAARNGEDWTRHPEIQRAASKVRRFSSMEGKWNMMSLLANTRSVTNNIVGGNVMTLVSTGLRPWLKTFDSSYWKTINPEWKSIEDLYRFAANSGAVESYIIDEVNLRGKKFTGRNVKNFIAESISSINAAYKGGKSLDDSDLIAIAKRNGLSEDFIQSAAYFMRAPERDLRMRSFMAHYFKAREVLGANKNVDRFDDPELIEMALRGVKGTQFLYNSAERPIFSSSSIGKIFSRFQLWSWNSIRFRRDVYKAARESGYQEGTVEFDNYKRAVQADLFMLGLASALPYTMFDSIVPAPFNYIQDLSSYFFGDESEKEKAFFGTLPYPLNVTGIVLPPSTRIFTALTALAGGDVDRFVDYHIYTLAPFGMMGRNIARTVSNPLMVVDTMTGVPIQRWSRYIRELREEAPRTNPLPLGNIEPEE